MPVKFRYAFELNCVYVLLGGIAQIDNASYSNTWYHSI